VPGHIRSDNGPERVAKAVRDWIAAGASPAYIERGSPWENGFNTDSHHGTPMPGAGAVHPINARLRDGLLDG